MFNTFIKEFYGVEIDESVIYYNESICDWSWGAILIVFQDNHKFFIVQPQQLHL